MKTKIITLFLSLAALLQAHGQNTWTQLNDFSGDARNGGVAFTIGNDTIFKDFYKFEPITGWTQIADFPGDKRYGAVSFVINGKAYVGTGTQNYSTNFSDMYKYNPNTDTWTQVADYPDALGHATGFAIGSSGFVCSGIAGTTQYSNLNEYISYSDTWVERIFSHSELQNRHYSKAVAMENKAYIIGGNIDAENVLVYDPDLPGDITVLNEFGSGYGELRSPILFKNQEFIHVVGGVTLDPEVSYPEFIYLNEVWEMEVHEVETPFMQCNFQVDSTGEFHTELSLTAGSGMGRAVFMTEGTTPLTVSNNEFYDGDTQFGQGSAVGEWFCVYRGDAASVSVAGLDNDQSYRIAALEYNEDADFDLISYNADYSHQTIFTLIRPTEQASNLVLEEDTYVDGRYSLEFTEGNGSAHTVLITTDMDAPVPNIDGRGFTSILFDGFQANTQVDGWYVFDVPYDNSTDITGFETGVDYKIMVCAHDGSSQFALYNYETAENNPILFNLSAITPPDTQASVNADTVGEYHTDFTITPGNGTGRAIFMSEGTATLPVNDNEFYTGNTEYGAGSAVGEWFCVYNGNETNVTISGLNSNQSYTIAAYEYNEDEENELIAYNTNYGPQFIFTMVRPTEQVSNLVLEEDPEVDGDFLLSFTEGNGLGRAGILTSKIEAELPNLDGQRFNPVYSQVFQEATSIDGWYVIGATNFNPLDLRGFEAGVDYKIMVCEYDGLVAMNALYNYETAENNPIIFNLAGVHDNLAKKQLQVAPNPSSNIFMISDVAAGQNYRVVDVSGQVVCEGITSRNELMIDMSDFGNGVYYFICNNHTAKLLKN
jgi:hypothetical protein